MKIPQALESMVADLISDEKQKREEVEAVLSQIHEMTEAYLKPPEPGSPAFVAQIQAINSATELVTLDKELTSQRKLFEAKGFPPEEAERRAKGILGID